MADVYSVLMRNARKRFEAGRASGLMDAIALAAQHGEPLPAWAAQGFLEGHGKIDRLEVRTWDEAFGPPDIDKGGQLAARRHWRKIQPEIYDFIEDMRKNQQRPLDNALFEDAAKAFGTNRDRAARLYREYAKAIEASQERF